MLNAFIIGHIYKILERGCASLIVHIRNEAMLGVDGIRIRSFWYHLIQHAIVCGDVSNNTWLPIFTHENIAALYLIDTYKPT
jgi:hypothetical protein